MFQFGPWKAEKFTFNLNFKDQNFWAHPRPSFLASALLRSDVIKNCLFYTSLHSQPLISHVCPNTTCKSLMLVPIPDVSSNPSCQSRPLMLVLTPHVSPNPSCQSQPLMLVLTPLCQSQSLMLVPTHNVSDNLSYTGNIVLRLDWLTPLIDIFLASLYNIGQMKKSLE